MRDATKFSVGDPITAAKMNELAGFAGTVNAGVPSGGGNVFGSETVNATNEYHPPTVILVYATENFKIQQTDHQEVDDVPSGKCNFVMLPNSTNKYTPQEEGGRDFFVHAPTPGTEKQKDDIFHVTWNKRTGRWEVLGGGSGSSIIRFQITASNCVGGFAEVHVLSNTGGIKGAFEKDGEFETDQDGEQVKKQFTYVYDMIGCFMNESDLNLNGRKGYATWMYGRPLNTAPHPYDPDPWWNYEITAICEQQNQCETFDGS